MRITLITPFIVSLAAVSLHAQVVNQWNFNDNAGTDLGSAVDSVGSASFSDSLGGGGTMTTDGSGLLSGLGRYGNADIADVSTGVYRFELKGVTFTSFSGGTDDSVFFGIRSFASSSNTGFSGGLPNDSSSNQAIIVFGNSNDSGGVDLEVIDNNARVSGVLTDVSADFSGTWDFRIVVDLDNDTVDYLYQIDGGGYTTIVSQQFNAMAAANYLAITDRNLLFGGGSRPGVRVQLKVQFLAITDTNSKKVCLSV